MTERLHFENRQSWLENRRRGIGASEAAAAAGLNPSYTRMKLWKLKTGQTEDEDLSGNELVQRGVRMENAIREWFKACHPELTVEHYPYDMLYQTERPWLYATLDGEVTVSATGEKGVLEIKTAEPRGRDGWAEWDGQIPQKYYCQLLHQYLATGRKHFWLIAALYSQNGDVTIREFYVEADETFRANAQWLLEAETLCWDYVQRKLPPPTPITF